VHSDYTVPCGSHSALQSCEPKCKVELMPFRLDYRLWTVDRRKKSKIHHPKSIVPNGFTLIELMVVISLFGIAASLVTASYLSFEKNQRVRSAASQLKGDLRLVQNNAYSGNKGSGAECSSSFSLGGWYLNTARGATSYTIGGDCITSTATYSEVRFLEKTINLPRDTMIRFISYSGNNDVTQPVAILYRPLSSDVSYHFSTTVVGIPPDLDFLDTTGNLKGYLQIPPQSAAIFVELSNTAQNRCSRIKVDLSGEVNEESSFSCS